MKEVFSEEIKNVEINNMEIDKICSDDKSIGNKYKNRESTLKTLKDKILKGYQVNMADIDILLLADIDLLTEYACEIRDSFFDKKFDLCTIINAKSGKCSEDCKFCAQSAHYSTGVEEYDILEDDEIVENAVLNYKNGVNRFSIVTSGRKLTETELDKVCNTFQKIKEKSPIKLCSSNGLLEFDQFIRLKESGVRRYHNNLETSKRFFPSICSTHTFDDKVRAIKDAKEAGLEICSGGIFGLGETIEDRIDMAITLRDLDVDSVPINVLNPIKNTPFENNSRVSYEELRRILAIYRFILPRTSIRLAGGRALLGDKGRVAIDSGVDSMISGEMLTTAGILTKEDIEMVKEMGFLVRDDI